MIRQDGNSNTGRSVGRSNAGRQALSAQRNYNRIPLVSDVLDMISGGGGQPEMQTTTQQNLPDWAIPDAMSTLAMGNYYTQTPDYRASTLDQDYSGLRGYGSMGQPNSQVGQFGLNPMGYTNPLLADPPSASITQRPMRGSLDDLPQSSRGMGRSTGYEIDLPDFNFDSLVEDTWLDNRPQSDPGELAYPTSLPETPTQSPQGDIRPPP